MTSIPGSSLELLDQYRSPYLLQLQPIFLHDLPAQSVTSKSRGGRKVDRARNVSAASVRSTSLRLTAFFRITLPLRRGLLPDEVTKSRYRSDLTNERLKHCLHLRPIINPLSVICTALQTVSLRVRFPMWSLECFIAIIHTGRAMALGSTQPPSEMSTRGISWMVKAAGA
jgi:hypothetical protein